MNIHQSIKTTIMKKVLFTIIGIAMTVLNCANAQENVKEFDIKGFERIEIKGSSEVVYNQGNEFNITVKASTPSLLEKAIVEKNGNTLILSNKNYESKNIGFFDMLKGIKNEISASNIVFYVTSPDLIGVTLTGSGDFECKTYLDTDNLDITLKGSGDIDFKDIICDKLNIYLSGSGDVEIDNVKTITSKVDLKGSGDVKFHQTDVKYTDLSLYGSGDIVVDCKNCGEVSASIKGSGDITIKGETTKVNQNVRGSGDINIR